eukprot:TRINITY_DN7373_c0_g2_i1.p3 TRINITY_DN7373_c0_g2~~TRINITY_DN7373_c0_g2_i1.p3  ORF type:complete len:109 (+),score=2.70 TRINITY_DN7373_c0_g2_i1:224-550(+)
MGGRKYARSHTYQRTTREFVRISESTILPLARTCPSFFRTAALVCIRETFHRRRKRPSYRRDGASPAGFPATLSPAPYRSFVSAFSEPPFQGLLRTVLLCRATENFSS